MLRRNIRWLLGELPDLVDGGVLTPEVAERLRRHYQPSRTSGSQLLTVLFATLGAVLVGGGLILLIAHNWDELDRSVKLALSFVPLILTQGLAVWVATRPAPRIARHEAVAAFWMLALAAALALVDQTYHLGGGLEGFLLRWAILGLPIVYLLRATVPAMLYLGAITSWVYAEGWSPGSTAPVVYWLLVGLLVPHLHALYRQEPQHPRTQTVAWTLGLSLLAVPPVAFQKLLPHAWIPLGCLLFGALYVLGRHLEAGDGSAWKRPLQIAGGLGIVVYGLVLSYEWAWQAVVRKMERFEADWGTVAIGELGIALLLAALLGIVAWRGTVDRQELATWGAAPLVATGAYLLASTTGETFLAMATINLYLLALGVTTLVLGVREGALGRTNVGLAVLSALILVRFFDAEVEFVARGVAFILLGIAFFTTNLVLTRRRAAS